MNEMHAVSAISPPLGIQMKYLGSKSSSLQVWSKNDDIQYEREKNDSALHIYYAFMFLYCTKINALL